MTITRQFESLDKLILAQFEKVTQKSQQIAGRNKYDLARVCETGTALTMGAMGIYGGGLVAGLAAPDWRLPFVGGAALVVSYFYHNYSMKLLYHLEDEEMDLILTSGASKSPEYSPYRPFNIGLALGIAISGLYIGNENHATYSASIPSSSRELLSIKLMLLTGGISNLCSIGTSYFRDCTMTPPACKKSWFKAVYERMKNVCIPRLDGEEVPAPDSIGS